MSGDVRHRRLVRFRDGEIQEDRPITHEDDVQTLHPPTEVGHI